MASYCGPVMTDACCTYWISAEYSLARSLLSSSMSCVRVSLLGVSCSSATGAAAVLGALTRVVFLVAFFAAGFATLDSFRRVTPEGPARCAPAMPTRVLPKTPVCTVSQPGAVSAARGTTSSSSLS